MSSSIAITAAADIGSVAIGSSSTAIRSPTRCADIEKRSSIPRTSSPTAFCAEGSIDCPINDASGRPSQSDAKRPSISPAAATTFIVAGSATISKPCG